MKQQVKIKIIDEIKYMKKMKDKNVKVQHPRHENLINPCFKRAYKMHQVPFV